MLEPAESGLDDVEASTLFNAFELFGDEQPQCYLTVNVYDTDFDEADEYVVGTYVNGGFLAHGRCSPLDGAVVDGVVVDGGGLVVVDGDGLVVDDGGVRDGDGRAPAHPLRRRRRQGQRLFRQVGGRVSTRVDARNSVAWQLEPLEGTAQECRSGTRAGVHLWLETCVGGILAVTVGSTPLP